MKNTIQIEVKDRDVFGKKVNKYRKNLQIPGNIFGKDFESKAIWLDEKNILQLLREVSESTLINLKTTSTSIPVLIRDIHRNPVKGTLQHLSFQKVNLKEKITSHVGVHLEGESEFIKNSGSVVDLVLSEIEVEALPAELPESITIDISQLASLDDQITIKDLKIDSKVTVLNDPDQLVVSVVEAQAEEVEEAPAVEEQEQIEDVVTTEQTPEETVDTIE